MKKLICILAGAALLGACEKTEVAAPAKPAPAATPDKALTGERPKKNRADVTTAISTADKKEIDPTGAAAASEPKIEPESIMAASPTP